MADGRIEFQKSVKTGNDIRKLGESLRNGQTVLTAGTEVTPGVIGVLATVKAARDTVMLATEMGRSAALQAARAASDACYHSKDAQEGPRAFAEKRRPVWRGE